MTILRIIIMIVAIISIAGLVIKVDMLKAENEILEKECHTLRNMYFNLKSAKLEDSEWKNMTSAQIAKVIIEEQYRMGKLDLDMLFNAGLIREKEREWYN